MPIPTFCYLYTNQLPIYKIISNFGNTLDDLQSFLVQKLLSEAVIFNVGKVTPPGGDFMLQEGEFVLYPMWGAVSVSTGAISAG